VPSRAQSARIARFSASGVSPSKARRCGRRSAELLPRAAELERRLAARYGPERLVNEYGELLREEFRVLPPGDAQRLDEAVGRRLDGRALP
jgi:hypothetical protein